MMYLKDDLIEAVSLDPTLLSTPGYLGKIKRTLKEKYASLILESNISAEFIVADILPATGKPSE